MTKFKSLPTLMEMNFKKLCGEVSQIDLENPSKYTQLIGAMMTDPLHAHWISAKYILRYFHWKITLGLRYSTKDVQLHGYTDID